MNAYPSNNTYDIPTLQAEHEATAIPLPGVPWGAYARHSRFRAGFLHFYTDDYRYERLWKNPDILNQTAITTIVEPNFSCHDNEPRAKFIWQTYRKRYLARYWQDSGINIIADLYAPPKYIRNGDAFLGIPAGWRAYATRAHPTEQHILIEQAHAARAHAHTDDILFIVIGGGERTHQLCQANNWIWIDQYRFQTKQQWHITEETHG